MTPERAVALRLAGWAGVIALVDGRVHSIALPQSPDLPAIRVAIVGEPQTYHLRGENYLTRARVQIDCYVDEDSTEDVDTEDQVDAISAAVQAALSGKTFYVGTPSVIRVTGAFAIGDRRKLREVQGEWRLLRSSQDYIVWSHPV